MAQKAKPKAPLYDPATADAALQAAVTATHQHDQQKSVYAKNRAAAKVKTPGPTATLPNGPTGTGFTPGRTIPTVQPSSASSGAKIGVRKPGGKAKPRPTKR